MLRRDDAFLRQAHGACGSASPARRDVAPCLELLVRALEAVCKTEPLEHGTVCAVLPQCCAAPGTPRSSSALLIAHMHVPSPAVCCLSPRQACFWFQAQFTQKLSVRWNYMTQNQCERCLFFFRCFVSMLKSNLCSAKLLSFSAQVSHSWCVSDCFAVSRVAGCVSTALPLHPDVDGPRAHSKCFVFKDFSFLSFNQKALYKRQLFSGFYLKVAL